MTETSTFM